MNKRAKIVYTIKIIFSIIYLLALILIIIVNTILKSPENILWQTIILIVSGTPLALLKTGKDSLG